MKIGIATPVSLHLLADLVEQGHELPTGYEFAPHAWLVREYVERGHEVSVFTLAPGLQAPREFRGDRLRIHVGRFRPSGRARDFFALERRDLLSAMGADRCDVVHAHWTYEFALAAIDSGLPHVVTAHDAPLEILKLHPDAYRFLRLLMAFRAVRGARVLTAVSSYVADHLRTRFLYGRPIHLVPNGIAPWVFSLESPGVRDRAAVRFASVLTGWSRRKNATTLLRAFKRVRSAVPGASLTLYGPGYGPGEAAAAWAGARGLCEGVEFAGAAPHRVLLERLAGTADVLVHPALEESFSMALAEAMAVGIPVIGGERSGGVPSTLDGGRAGRLVDVRSPRLLAEAMLELATRPELRSTLADAARRSARARFPMARVVDEYEGIYEAVCGR